MLVAAACLSLALAGCSASSTVDPVASAAGATQSLPGVRFLISGEVSSVALPKPLRISGSGYVTNAPAASLHLAFLGLPRRVAGGSLTLELRRIGDVIFVRLPLGKKLGGRSWIKVDTRRTQQAAGLEGLPSTDELDPDQYLTYLRSVSGGLTSLGSQVIRGVPTKGYRGEIKLQDVAARLPPSRRAQAVAAIGNLERITGITSIPFEVWIDGSHHVRRLSIAYGETRSEGAQVYITIDYIGFGRQPRVLAPPSSQVLDKTSAVTAAAKATANKHAASSSAGTAR